MARISTFPPLWAVLLNTAGFRPGEIENLAQRDAPYYLRLADGRHVALAAARLLPLVLALHAMRLSGHFSRGFGKGCAEPPGHRAAAGTPRPAASRSAARTSCAGSPGWCAARNWPFRPLPADFKAELRPYQLAGVAWLDLLREAGLGGILADDMGLGKTVQILALLAMEKARGSAGKPTLIVAPTSLMENWSRESPASSRRP